MWNLEYSEVSPCKGSWYGIAGPEQVPEKTVIKATTGAPPYGGSRYLKGGMGASAPIIDLLMWISWEMIGVMVWELRSQMPPRCDNPRMGTVTQKLFLAYLTKANIIAAIRCGPRKRDWWRRYERLYLFTMVYSRANARNPCINCSGSG